MLIVDIVLGIALLIAGRQLFWVFVGGLGFIMGFDAASQFLHDQPQWVFLAVALVTGFLGAIVAVFLQRIAAGMAGFMAGAYILLTLGSELGWDGGPQLHWILFFAGGIVGAILVVLLFDWALIVLSSLTGAVLISRSVLLGPGVRIALLIALLIIGIALQAKLLQRRGYPPVRR